MDLLWCGHHVVLVVVKASNRLQGAGANRNGKSKRPNYDIIFERSCFFYTKTESLSFSTNFIIDFKR